MPTGSSAASPGPAEPRLPEVLPRLSPAILEDEAEWSGIEVVGEVQGPEEISHLEVASSHLRQVRLPGRQFDQLRFVDVLLEDCDLSFATLSRASFVRVEFRRCRMSGLIGAGLRAKDVRFTDVKLDGANLRMTECERSSFERCDLSEVDFYSARLPAARLVECNLTGAQLAKSEVKGAALHGSALEGVRGAESVRGVVIGSDQILPLSLSVFTALGITVDDDHLD